MKTIFITIFEGVEVKNILRTPIIEHLLKDAQVRIVLFTKNKEKVEYYQKEFSDNRFIFEVVEWKFTSKLDKFFSKLKFILLRTKTTNLKRRMAFQLEGNYVRYVCGHILNYLLARSFVRKITRFLDFKFLIDATYSEFFDKYKPDVVLLAHLFDEPEITLLREAKRRKVPSIGFINSWDKVTSRAIMRLLPDIAIVFNHIVKEELVEYNEMDSKKIVVAGLPQSDVFFTTKPVQREEFFKRIGIHPDKKLIVYASMGRAFSVSDWDMIDYLRSLVEGNLLKYECDLLVRFQPNDFVDNEELEKRPQLKYDLPGIRFGTKRGVDWDMNTNDIESLKNTLYHMSILVSYASSISIDAAVFNKPVININFEIKENNILFKSPTQYYESEHYLKALHTGGITLVKSKDDLIQSINSYLDNPDLQSTERKRLISEQYVFTDGNSGKRITECILNQIK